MARRAERKTLLHPHRLKKESRRAVDAWGGGSTLIQTSGGVALLDRRGLEPVVAGEVGDQKWLPKRELWPGFVADDEPELFGPVCRGLEVEVRVTYGKARKSEGWLVGIVLAVDEERGRAAICLAKGKKDVVDVPLGEGMLRRAEDSRRRLDEVALREIRAFRVRDDAAGLHRYVLEKVKDRPTRSFAVTGLCFMGKAQMAKTLLDEAGFEIHSVALRHLAHGLASEGDLDEMVTCLPDLREHMAAQLLVESLALALNARLAREVELFGSRTAVFLDDEASAGLAALADRVGDVLQRHMAGLIEGVRAMPGTESKDGLVEAFNELLFACGRTLSVHISFRVLEWMESAGLPKNNFTYEAIGSNVAKRVSLVKKVWDLPSAPEAGPPEIVFAGRSNVGKSSLVNMLLGRVAMAPTSARPGKTKTMDFFDVNKGHASLPYFRLVDVPGLGFARVSADMRQRFVNLIGGYFAERSTLKIVFHLLDAGLGEILPADRELWRMLAQAQREDLELCVCLTKADNSTPEQMTRFAADVRDCLSDGGSLLAQRATIFGCSSHTRMGKDTLWRKIWSSIGGYEADGYGPPREVKFRSEEFIETPATQRSEAYRAARFSPDEQTPAKTTKSDAAKWQPLQPIDLD